MGAAAVEQRGAASSGARERFTELDGLRGVAALCVVALHFTSEYDHFFPSEHPFALPVRYGDLGVHLFFLISGFVIFQTTTKYSRPTSFVKARLVRLYPAYWVCLCLTLVSTALWPVYRQPWVTNLVNFTMVQSFLRVRDVDGVYWSLARELSFYALITMLLFIGKGRISPRVVTWTVVVWATLGLLLTVTLHVSHSHAVDMVTRLLAAEYAPLFGLGMLLSDVRRGARRFSALIPALAVLAGVCHWCVDEDLTRSLLITFVVVPVFAMVAVRSRTKIFRARILVWFGGISYPLYLLHQNIGHAIIHGVRPHVGTSLSVAIASVAVCLLAWAVHRFIEVWLGSRLHRRLFPRTPHDSVPAPTVA